LKSVIFIPCSGAEYNGELARQAAIRLSEKSSIAKNCSVLCLTITLKYFILKKEQYFNIMKNNITSNFSVIIDGCSGACAFQIFRKLDIKPDLVINVNKIVPKKILNLKDINELTQISQMSNIKEKDIEKVCDYILQKLKENDIF